MLLVASKISKYMTGNVPGIFVSQGPVDEPASTPKGEASGKGIEIATLIRSSLCDGVHISQAVSYPWGGQLSPLVDLS